MGPHMFRQKEKKKMYNLNKWFTHKWYKIDLKQILKMGIHLSYHKQVTKYENQINLHLF